MGSLKVTFPTTSQVSTITNNRLNKVTGGQDASLTVEQPLAEITRTSSLRSINKLLLQSPTQEANGLIDMRLQRQHPRHGVILCNGPLLQRMHLRVTFAEEIVNDFTVALCTTSVIELGFAVVAAGAVDGADHLGHIQVDHIGRDPNHRTVLFVQFSGQDMHLSLPDVIHPPEVGPSWRKQHPLGLLHRSCWDIPYLPARIGPGKRRRGEMRYVNRYQTMRAAHRAPTNGLTMPLRPKSNATD